MPWLTRIPTRKGPYEPLPLKGNWIRVLHLFPGKPLEQVSCTLSLANLDALEQPYQAISYVWGDSIQHHHIRLNNFPFEVRSNLYHILCAFRRLDRTVTLWIDALCIDQSSLKERNHQVGKMARIFSGAERVNAWIDALDAELGKALDCFDKVVEIQDQELWPLSSTMIDWIKQSIVKFESNNYWSRAWIVQELVLAREIAFFLGRRSFTWSNLMDSVALIGKPLSPILRAVARTRTSKEHRSFEELFATFGYLQCSTSQDRFFSLYGMVIESPVRPLLQPDYGMCTSEVFLNHLNRVEGLSDYKQFAFNFFSHFGQDDHVRHLQHVVKSEYRSIEFPLGIRLRSELLEFPYGTMCYTMKTNRKGNRRRIKHYGELLVGDLALPLKAQKRSFLVARWISEYHRREGSSIGSVELIALVEDVDNRLTLFPLPERLSNCWPIVGLEVDDEHHICTLEFP